MEIISPLHLTTHIHSRLDKACAYLAAPLQTDIKKTYPGMGTVGDIVANTSLIGFAIDLAFKGMNYMKNGDSPGLLSWLRSIVIFGVGFVLPKLGQVKGNKILKRDGEVDELELYKQHFIEIHKNIHNAIKQNTSKQNYHKQMNKAFSDPLDQSSTSFFASFGFKAYYLDDSKKDTIILESIAPEELSSYGFSAHATCMITNDRYYGIRLFLNSITSHEQLLNSEVNMQIISKPKTGDSLDWTATNNKHLLAYRSIDFSVENPKYIDNLAKLVKDPANSNELTGTYGDTASSEPEEVEQIYNINDYRTSQA